jgi:hypothetical protein
MAQEFRIDTVLVSNRVRLNNDAAQGVVGLPSAAWYGELGVAGVRIDDPLGELDLRGWHTFTHDETSCTGNERTFSGWITGKTITRGPFRYGAARVWECEVIDLNQAFQLEVFRASSAKRPEETDIERVAWAQASAPMAGTPLHDNGRFNITDNPINFGPADYVTQKPQALFESVAGTSGKNFYAYFDQDNEEPSLHYDLIAAAPASTLRISNVESDADSTTFYPFIDASLVRSPEDQYTGELLGYLGGNYVYARNAALIAELSPTEFSPVNFLRDNVKTTDRIGKLTTANSQVAADLAALAVEVDTITCSIRVPASQVNLLMAGDACDVKFSHLPSYEDFVTVPVIRRNVIPTDGRRDMYDLHLTLSNQIQAIGPGGGAGDGPYVGDCTDEFIIPGGTYDSLHSVDDPMVGSIDVPSDLVGQICFRLLGPDLHGFDGWPAGGVGGTHTVLILYSGPAIPLNFAGQSGTDPTPFDQTFVLDLGDSNAIKGQTVTFLFRNGDNRESWHMELEYGVMFGFTDPAYPEVAPCVPGENPPGALMHVNDETVTMAGDTGTTRFPFVAGSLFVHVDDTNQTPAIIATDPDAGTFQLAFTPTPTEVVVVDYQANVGGPGT